jgi:hypothetical protein
MNPDMVLELEPEFLKIPIFLGKKILELLVNWLITIGFRPVHPESETNLILESEPESKPELYFFQEPNQNQN